MRAEQPDSDQLTLWRSHPCTRWVLQELMETFPLQWQGAQTWEELNRLKGQSEVMTWLAEQVR